MNTTSKAETATRISSQIPFRSIASSVIRTDASTATAILRLTIAVVIFPHGAQKMLGWFGGYGFNGTMDFFTGTMGIPWLLAFGVIMIEFFGPVLLFLGAATRPAAFALGVVLTTAMFMVHVQHGFFMNWFGNQNGEGIEYFLLVAGIALALVISGGGRWSVDRAADRAIGEA